MAKNNLSPLRILMTQTDESPMLRLMGLKGFTQRDLAAQLGVTPHTVSNWINGKTTPCLSLKDWHKLADLLGTTIDKLPINFASDAIADE